MDDEDELVPQLTIQSPEMERLVRAMGEAMHFLTVKVDKPARIQNAQRIEDASCVLGVALFPYCAELDRLHHEDQKEADEFERRMKFNLINGGLSASK